jgi:protein-L-isoaspartate(D-aspartate) O-methyltransferase
MAVLGSSLSLKKSSKANVAAERKLMVKQQLEGRDIVDRRVLAVFKKIPRQDFVPVKYRQQAYRDSPLPLGYGQTISQPYIVALMTQLLELKGEERVLEIGTGSGYQAAVLASLAKAVYTVEKQPRLLARAKKVFRKLKLDNIKTKNGDGSRGWKKYAPYDGIMVTAAAQKIPEALIKQLAEGGKLVIPVGRGFWQELIRLTKKEGKVTRESFGGCAFVPLVSD